MYIDRESLEKKVKKMKNVDGIATTFRSRATCPTSNWAVVGRSPAYDRVGYGIAFNVITLDVKDGVVTLGGRCTTIQQGSAIGIAETTTGVKDVVDNIEVAPSSMFDDQLRVKLYRAIYRESTLQRYEVDPQKPIRIVVENGHVTL